MEELSHTGLIYVLCLFSLLCVCLSGFSLLLYFRSNSRLKELWESLIVLEQKIESRANYRGNSDDNFNDHLDKEELLSRFEKITTYKTEIPEKYRHVAKLEQSGLQAREIAEILDVSENEAEQILSLARLSGIRKQVHKKRNGSINIRRSMIDRDQRPKAWSKLDDKKFKDNSNSKIAP